MTGASHSPPPLRVLHVVGSLSRGGIETWLLHVLRNIDRGRFAMDFLVQTDKPCPYDEEVRRLESTIHICPQPKRPWVYGPAFKRILRTHGPYDIVHSHVHHYSGLNLRLAAQAGVPVRISHSHNDTSADDRRSRGLRRLYLKIMDGWIQRYSTLGLACSRQAAASLFGPHWNADRRWRVLYYGIDLAPFHARVDRVQARAEFGIPPEAFVIGHIGRFQPQKNHPFLVQIAAALAAREPGMRLLLIGDGPLRPEIEAQVKALGLAEKTVFAGGRSDVPRLMLGAMDVFVLPSHFEGLGIVGLEAQAAGLPVVISDVVPSELDVFPQAVTRLALDRPAADWAEAILATRRGPPLDQRQMLRDLEQGPFNIHNSVQELARVYAG